MRKKIVSIFVMTLLITIVVLPIVNSLNVNEKTTEVNDDIKITVKLSDKEPYNICFPPSTLDISSVKRFKLPNMAHPAFAYTGDQIHPAFDRTSNGIHTAAFNHVPYGEILWGFSEDDGDSYNDSFRYWPIGGDYPSIKHRNDTTFYGTFVSDPNDNSVYLFKTDDPTDIWSYELDYWDLTSMGFHNITDADIACDSSQQPYEWGVSSYILSRYDDIDVPAIVFSDPDTGMWWISWYYYYEGCVQTDVDIDHDEKVSYSLYNWEDPISGYLKLLCRVKDFADPINGSDHLYEINVSGNTTQPFETLRNQSIATSADGHFVICAETDAIGEPTHSDIICIYGDDMGNPGDSIVVNSPNHNERNPDVRHIGGNEFVVIYNTHHILSMPKTLEASITLDGGISWSKIRWNISENYNCVLEEYKSHDLCGNGVYAMWEEQCIGSPDSDIYIGPVIHIKPPEAPSISGPSSGKTGTSYDFTFNAVDPEGDNIHFIIDWGDGYIDNTTLNPSGVDLIVSHTWTAENDYVITAYAIDEFGLEGPETEKTFTAPRNRAINIPYFNFLRYHPNMFPILRLLFQRFGLQ